MRLNAFTYIILIAVFVTGCFSVTQIKDGHEAYRMKHYMTAAEMLQEEFDKAEDTLDKANTAFLIGQSYRLANHTRDAESWYQQARQLGAGDSAWFYHALTMKQNQKYEEAIAEFNQYIESMGDMAARAQKEREGAQLAIKWMNSKTKYVVSEMPGLNSPASDYAPVFYENNALVFTSDRKEAEGDEIYGWTGNEFSDLFISRKEGDNYAAPEPFSDVLNTEMHEGTTMDFSNNFTEVYFTKCSDGIDDVVPCKIYFSKRDGDKWTEPVQLAFFDTLVNEGHPTLSDDGNTMIFAADAPGGLGGKDLYMATRSGDDWSTAVNLGAGVNTAQDEMFPYLHKNGNLFFSSSGHAGMGGLDIFMSEKSGNTWGGSIINLGFPMNSGQDDFGVVFDEFQTLNQSGFFEEVGFLSSTRFGGAGDDDVYKFVVELPAHFALEGKVLEKVFEDPQDPNSKVIDYNVLPGSDVELVMYDKQTGMETLKDTATADEDGEFFFELEPDSDYKVIALNNGYFTKTEFITTRGIKGSKNMAVTLSVEIVLDRIYEEKQIVIHNIYYDYNKWYIRPDAAKVLDTLAMMLKDNPGIRIELGSHTDSRGSASYNEKLSQKRAESAVKYLVSKGISRRRLEPRGYGESMLVNNCRDGVECTEEQHQRNRRTTFKVIAGDIELESIEPEEVEVDEAPEDRK